MSTPHTPHIIQMGMTYKDVILTPPVKTCIPRIPRIPAIQNWTFLSAEGYESLANPGNPYGQSATPHTPHIVQMGMTDEKVILTSPL